MGSSFYVFKKGDKMNFKRVAPIILTGISVIASIAAVVMSAHDTPRAIEILDDHRLELDPTGETELLMSEKLKDYAKGYWRTGILLGVSIGSCIASCVISNHNYKALASAAALTAAYTAKYRSKVRDVIGKEKEKLLDQQVRKEVKPKNFTDAVVFHYDFPKDENGFRMYEPIEFKASLKDMYEQYIDGLQQIANLEVISIGDMFPQMYKAIPKNDPRQYQLDRIWHTDMLLDGYDVMVPSIYFDPVNIKGSENESYVHSDHINDGKPAYIIRCMEDPEPPEYLMTADC